MKSILFKYHLALSFVLLISGCAKEETSLPLINPDSIRIMPFSGVTGVEAAVAGDGVVLLVFFDDLLKRQFALIDNDGNLIWKKHIDLNGSIFTVLDYDNNFAVFSGTRLIRINRDGQIIYDNPGFLSGGYFDIARIQVLQNGDYLLVGSTWLNGNRSVARKVSYTGEQHFNLLYAINVQGEQAYTSSAILSDGNFLLVGSFNSRTPGLNDHIFISLLNENGEILWTNLHEVQEYEPESPLSNFEMNGRDLIPLAGNEYLYVLSPKSSQSAEQRTKILKINALGELLPQIEYADLSELNVAPGAYRAFNSLQRNENGTFSGIINSNFLSQSSNLFYGIPTNYTSPEYAYVFELDSQGMMTGSEYVDQNYSNYLHSIVRLSNGKNMLIGSILSLGIELRIIVIIRE